jgi:hypothetical protein
MTNFISVKRKAGQAFLAGADIAGMVLSFSGAAVVAFVGKLMLSVVLLAISLGFFLRLSGRRRVVVAPRPLPRWSRPAACGFAVLEVAALTEATDLPVRFHQAGFETWHWGLVVVALLAAYALNMRLLAAFSRGAGVTAQS